MKFYLFIIFQFIVAITFAQADFDSLFVNKTLRLDYIRGGNRSESHIYFKRLKQEPFWGGSHKNLIDTFYYGDYYIKLYSKNNDSLIYSRGYSTIFREWQDTDEATKLARSFSETVIMPYPKAQVRIELESRNRKNEYHTEFSLEVNPEDIFIEKDSIIYKSKDVIINGNSQNHIDIVIIPEAYTSMQNEKLHQDVQRFIDYFFKVEPFASNKTKFNFRLIEEFSVDGSVDNPGKDEWKNTLVNSHFYTFNMARYLTSDDIESIRNLAATVPYDQIYILVNTTEYGGGGVFNYYNLCVSDHPLAEEVFTHEFGHGFGGLADEYAYDNTDLEHYYTRNAEPNAPNITTLAAFESKWKDMLKDDTPIPTPDSVKVEVGVYEGGGYVKKGVYRPAYDCKMRSNNTNAFCPVCRKALEQMILFYTE